MTTTPDLDQAREWAKSNLDKGHFAYGGRVMAAAHVIASLPDEWIDSAKLREALDWRDSKPSGDDYDAEFYDRLRALLPAPTPRTLADMTDEERQACRWMQCEVAETENHYSGRGVILYPGDVGRATNVISEDGAWWLGISMEAVTPLPDLPRMVWPDEHYLTTDEDVSIIPPKIDTSTRHDDHVDMTPEDVPEEGPWIVDFHGDRYVGARDPYESPKPSQPRPEDVPAGEQDMEEQTAVVDRGWIYHGDTERSHLPDGTTVRRFVTDWEVKE